MNSKSDDVVVCKLGRACVPSMVASGYAFIVLAIFPFLTMQISGYIASAVFVLFGFFSVLTTTGIILDLRQKKLNNYYKYFGFIKKNNWIDISTYKNITVLKVNKVNMTYSRSNRSLRQENKTYEVYLTDDKNSKRQLVSVFSHAKQAVDFAKETAIKLNVSFIANYHDSGWDD